MSSPPLDSQRLRLLVALAVLKCKPVNQTCFAYIQTLKACFPCNQPDKETFETSSKERIVNLENECKSLREKLEQAKLQTLVQPGNQASNPTTSKKKVKSKQDIYSGQELADSPFDLRALIKISDIGKSSKKGAHSPNLFETFDTFFKVSALHGQTDFPEDIFISVTRRALDSLSRSLDYTVNETMDFGRLRTLDALLRVTIEKSFPIIGSYSLAFQSSVDLDPWTVILDQLSSTILIPLSRSFFLHSKKNLEYLLLDDRKRSKSSACKDGCRPSGPDARPALLGFFHGVITAMQSNLLFLARPHLGKTNWSRKSRQALADRYRASLAELSLMHYSLILQSIHYLNQILSDQVTQPGSGSTKHRRILRLVVKDTIWYICSILHIVIKLVSQLEAAWPPDDVMSHNIGNTTNSSSNSNNGPHNANTFGKNASHRLLVMKKAVMSCFVALLMRQDRARRLGNPTTDLVTPATTSMECAPMVRKCQGSGDWNIGTGLDDEGQSRVGAAIQTQTQTQSGVKMVGPVAVAVADADGGSGRSIQASGQFGPSSSNDRALSGGGGGGGYTGDNIVPGSVNAPPDVDIIHPSPLGSKKKMDRMQVVLDDREYTMLLGVVESYFNLPCNLS